MNKIGAFSRSSPEHVEQTCAPGACSGACSNSSLLRSSLLRSRQNNLCSGAMLRSTGAKMSAPGCSGAQLLRSSACAPMPCFQVIVNCCICAHAFLQNFTIDSIFVTMHVSFHLNLTFFIILLYFSFAHTCGSHTYLGLTLSFS